MAGFRSERRRAAPARPAVKAGDCPRVADLIDFAQGRLDGSEREQVEIHLKGTDCPDCRRWLAHSAPSAESSHPGSNSAIRAANVDPAQWQRRAFLDLEKRLKQLEE
ncbi:MAG: zf-HC2 domain-containing protein [Planctomycetia bacterium]|nr:zf-HC2 domain-containing protein [Planctomycetia bacterium]